jgi:hypothetical protein
VKQIAVQEIIVKSYEKAVHVARGRIEALRQELETLPVEGE